MVYLITVLANKYNIANSTSDYHQILNDDDVDFGACYHSASYARKMTIQAINANKSVFVEKPLAINKKELDEIIEAYNANNVNITVGFNRRFDLAKKIKKALGSYNIPINIIATMNAGFIPKMFGFMIWILVEEGL